MKKKLLIGLVVLLTLAIFIGVVLVNNYILSPVSLELTLSPTEVINDPKFSELTLTIKSKRDIQDVSGKIILPDSLELVKGNLEWEIDLQKNELKEFKITIRSVKEGEGIISVSIKNEDVEIFEEFTTKVGPDGEIETSSSKAESVIFDKESAPEWVLDKAKEYIVSYVGGEYFSEYISVKRSETKPEIDKISAKYKIDYIYKFKVKGDVDETSIEFSLWLDPDGELVEYSGIKYRGPQKPYAFSISRSKALEIAKEEGLPESETIVVGKAGQTYNITKLTIARIEFGPKFNIDESYIWYVTTENFKAGKPIVVYIDVDSGKVIGIFTEPEVPTVPPIEVLTPEQKSLVDKIIGRENPEILEKTSLFKVETMPGNPNQFKLTYLRFTAIPEDTLQAIIIIDLENEEIISIEKNW